jgi:hypothetical protein
MRLGPDARDVVIEHAVPLPRGDKSTPAVCSILTTVAAD